MKLRIYREILRLALTLPEVEIVLWLQQSSLVRGMVIVTEWINLFIGVSLHFYSYSSRVARTIMYNVTKVSVLRDFR